MKSGIWNLMHLCLYVFYCFKVNIVLGDPFFHSSILPWHNLYFWYAKEDLRWAFANDVIVLPSRSFLKGIAVAFKDLHLIKSPVGRLPSLKAENDPLDFGYDLQDFDDLVLVGTHNIQ